MPIRVTIARTDKEIDDALWVRHEVFVIEDGKFGGAPKPDERLYDRYDAGRSAENVIAYDGDEPVATMRLMRDTTFGLPVDDLYDFTPYREKCLAEGAGDAPVVFGSAGMLAVRQKWRRKRSVIRAMCKMAANVCKDKGATHIMVAVNFETASMYKRLGFTPLEERVWNAKVGNYVVPLVAKTEEFLAWAYGTIPDTPLGQFQESFERVLASPRESVFKQGDIGRHAYIVESGRVSIVRTAPDGSEFTLAHLRRGDLFGEMALIDDGPRSATAIAQTDVELISLDRAAFLVALDEHPGALRDVLKLMAQRIRALDDVLMVHSYSETKERLEFALDKARMNTDVDRKDSNFLMFHGGPSVIASSAGVAEPEAREYLDDCARRGLLEYTERSIRFPRAESP